MIKSLLYSLSLLTVLLLPYKSEAIHGNKLTSSNYELNVNDNNLFITKVIPRHASENIELDSKIIISFNQEIKINDGEIIIYNSDESIFEFFNKDSDRFYIKDNKIIIEPTNDFEENSKYYVEISYGTITNNEGDIFIGLKNKSWNFSTIKEDIYTDIFQRQKPIFFPNPAINTIFFKNTERLTNVKIINLTGRCVLKVEYPFVSASLANIPKGMYFVNYFFSDGSMTTDKLLKK